MKTSGWYLQIDSICSIKRNFRHDLDGNMSRQDRAVYSGNRRKRAVLAVIIRYQRRRIGKCGLITVEMTACQAQLKNECSDDDDTMSRPQPRR